MKLTNPYKYPTPCYEQFIVHTESGIYLEAHSTEAQAEKAAAVLNKHNKTVLAFPDLITYSHINLIEEIKIR